MTLITYYFKTILSWFICINFFEFILKGLVIILAFFAPIQTFIYLIFLAVTIDLLSGICCACIKKVKIESHKIRNTFIKLFVYTGLIMVVYGIEYLMWGIPITNMIAIAILLTEAFSIAENLDIISGGRTNFKGIITSIKKIFNKRNKLEE
jgi:hypothetical protein